jgi:hypothetical protein
MQAAIKGILTAQEHAEGQETIVVYDEALSTVFRVRTSFKEISRKLPSNCRWVPDYRKLRWMGFYAGWGIAGLIFFFAMLAGVKFGGGTAAYWVAGLAFISSPLFAWGCWSYAPKYRAHDYLPFSAVRRITQDASAEPPPGAWKETVGTDDGRIAYIVPYAHSFLNLANPQEEESGDRYHPFVARASVLYKDSKMEDATFIMSAKPDTWSRIKQLTLFGVIAVELVFLFLILNVING